MISYLDLITAERPLVYYILARGASQTL